MPRLPRPLPALALAAATLVLAGCEVDRELPGGGSISLSPTEPLPGGSLNASGGAACVGIDERGRRGLLARGRCEGREDGVIRAP